jgi:hypothetical protein
MEAHAAARASCVFAVLSFRAKSAFRKLANNPDEDFRLTINYAKPGKVKNYFTICALLLKLIIR